MDIGIINCDRDLAERLFPEFVRHRIEDPTVRCVAVNDDGDICASALLGGDPGNPERATIHYIGITPEGGPEYFMPLYNHIEKICSEEGISILETMAIDGGDNIGTIRRLLSEHSNSLSESDRRILVYEVGDLINSDFAVKMPDWETIPKYIKCFNELEEGQLDRYRNEIKAQEGWDFTPTDKVFGRYFVTNGHILASLDMEEVDMGVLYVGKLHALKTYNSKFAVPAVFTSAIWVASSLTEEDTRVYINISRDSLVNGIIKFFGPARYEYKAVACEKYIAVL